MPELALNVGQLCVKLVLLSVFGRVEVLVCHTHVFWRMLIFGGGQAEHKKSVDVVTIHTSRALPKPTNTG